VTPTLLKSETTVEATALANVPKNGAIPARDTSPLQVLDALMERGASVDDLAKLFELQKDYDAREAARAFNAAMIACQGEMPEIVRNKKNEQTGSWYADITSAHKTMKPVYMKHGFSCVHSQGESDKPDHYRWTCKVSHVGGHHEMHQLDLPNDDAGMKGGKCKTAVQGAASSGTYAQRILECRAFNVTIPWLDTDGNRTPNGSGRGPIVTDDEALQVEDFVKEHGLQEDMTRLFKWLKLPDKAYTSIPADQHAVIMSALSRKLSDRRGAAR
jgi:hypothetical protein